MTSIYPKFSKPAPMFLDLNFKRLSKINTYPPPFGIKTQEKIIKLILAHTKNYGLGSELDSLNCKRCIIIGNGGILSNKSLGSKIDEYDVVIRLNKAPISGFERDVGSKTTMRITYPEGAIQYPERYENHSLFVFSAFKPLDFKWLRQMVFKERLHHTEGFWKSVALVVPRDPEDMRILNPYFIQEAAFWFIGLPHNNGLMGHGVRELRKCPHPPRLDIHTHAHLNPAHDCFYSRGNICPYADPCSDPRTDLCIGLCAGPCADPYAYPLW